MFAFNAPLVLSLTILAGAPQAAPQRQHPPMKRGSRRKDSAPSPSTIRAIPPCAPT